MKYIFIGCTDSAYGKGHKYFNFTKCKEYEIKEEWVISDTDELILVSNNARKKYFIKTNLLSK